LRVATYSVDGKQYVAVVTGGGGPLDGGSGSFVPEINNPAGGTTLWVFELPTPGKPVKGPAGRN
jgi:alcohol dehydrogenase (cytochrome c)